MWTMVKIIALEKDVSAIRHYLSPSLWANVIMALGAVATIVYLATLIHH
jgi:hypothetical protein